MAKKYSYVACSRKSKTCSCPVLSALTGSDNSIVAYEIVDDYSNEVEFSVMEMEALWRADNAVIGSEADVLLEVVGLNGTVVMKEAELGMILERVSEDGIGH